MSEIETQVFKCEKVKCAKRTSGVLYDCANKKYDFDITLITIDFCVHLSANLCNYVKSMVCAIYC